MKKLFPIILLMAIFLFGCGNTDPGLPETGGDSVSSATAELTTDIPSTPVPSPTVKPTEVPLYVGLSVEETVILREQCLQKNPGALCLPLPFEPELEGQFVQKEFNGNVVSNYEISIPSGTELFSPLGEEMVIEGIVFGSFQVRFLSPNRSIDGLYSINFQYGPLGSYNTVGTLVGETIPDGFQSEPNYQTFPLWELVIAKNDSCLGDNQLLTETDFSTGSSSGRVAMGEHLGIVRGEGLCLLIRHNVLIRTTTTFYGGDGVGHTTIGEGVITNFTTADLLTNEFGSVVFVVP